MEKGKPFSAVHLSMLPLPFKLEVDASANGTRAVWLQKDGKGIDRPIGYFKKHQVNYSTIEKEALALLFALQHLEVIAGSHSLPVMVPTDHNQLVFLVQMQNPNQRLMRWSFFVQDFNLEIRYKKETENVLADVLIQNIKHFGGNASKPF